MDAQGYHCAHNLRLRAALLLQEMDRWHDWATDVEDTALIEQIEGCLKAMHRKKVAVCIVHEKQQVSGGWEKNHSANAAHWSRKSDDFQAEEMAINPAGDGYGTAAAE